MNLSTLSDHELQKEFFRINEQYLIARAAKEFINDPAYLKIREELRNVLDELQRRLEQG